MAAALTLFAICFSFLMAADVTAPASPSQSPVTLVCWADDTNNAFFTSLTLRHTIAGSDTD